jgi:hypothetical protein
MPPSKTNAGPLAGELAEQTQKKTELRQLLWRFISSIALITAAVGVATVVARWTGRLG